jgi:trehalose-6-phosphate synthase
MLSLVPDAISANTRLISAVRSNEYAYRGSMSSRSFAGAAYELDTAVIANPYDPEAVAEALQTALGMPPEERRARWRAMMAVLRRNSITAWRESFLGALSC